ncbi:MAG: retroviral-like aspartic protease family protein [Gammaproteobacteria bacterium]|nr:retroviral-like aspartic protease family protein [Gammaproteobacteria bacterium]MBU1623479.1 retroviral-like aspartic protease family protein [Gammaproteobacteria bacterium]MBU1982318.1 retroviral-like aspartic protease family protein [Gammaproteobacteria bacterium]
MTESANDAAGDALFARIRQMVMTRGVDIRLQQEAATLKLLFADGQRILINLDQQSRHVWLAAADGGSEFLPQGASWQSAQHGELFARLGTLLDQTIASNPRNSRTTPPPTQEATPVIIRHVQSGGGHGLRNTMIIILLCTVAYLLLQRSGHTPRIEQPEAAQANSATLADSRRQCESSFPNNGNTTVFPESGLQLGSTGTELTLKNDHAHPLLVILTAPRSLIPSVSVMVHARQQTSVRIPPGQYDLMFAAGSNWCDARYGFSDGRMLKFDNSLSVQHDAPMRIAMQSSGAGPEDFRALISTFVPATPLPTPSFSGDGSMAVKRHSNGHFYLPGSIAGVPVTFMLDTGASVTSITSAIAREAGVHNCKEIQFQTANGNTTGCIALLPQMTLGNFTLKNITVAVMPNMETNLLGANVLRNFHVGQDEDTLLIGRN